MTTRNNIAVFLQLCIRAPRSETLRRLEWAMAIAGKAGMNEGRQGWRQAQKHAVCVKTREWGCCVFWGGGRPRKHAPEEQVEVKWAQKGCMASCGDFTKAGRPAGPGGAGPGQHCVATLLQHAQAAHGCRVAAGPSAAAEQWRRATGSPQPSRISTSGRRSRSATSHATRYIVAGEASREARRGSDATSSTPAASGVGQASRDQI